MAAFPAYPLLMFDGYEEQPQEVVDRTEMETGPVKQAPRQSLGMLQRPVKYLIVSNADLASFKTFVKTTLHMGADWFDWTDPVDTVTKSARIVGGYGGIRFAPRRKNLANTKWVASFQLESYA